MPTDNAPMVIALGEVYTEGDKKWFRVGGSDLPA